MAACEIEDCDRPVLAKGLCASHYQARRLSAIRARARALERICRFCNEPFAGRDVRATYCSAGCKEAAHNARRPKTVKERPTGRTCRECGVGIDERPTNARFCSHKCVRRHSERELRRARNIKLARRCPVCGAEMGELDPLYKKYCSEKCRHLVERARLYGTTAAKLHDLAIAQDNRCAICKTGAPGGRGNWHVDHCHNSTRVRGLLCAKCNTGLGQFDDDPVRLRAAADYLEN